MRLSTITSVSVLGLVAFVSAAPHPLDNSILPERLVQEKRGMVWVPRKLQQRKNSNTEIVQITDITEEQITEVQRGQEVQLTVLVEKKITEIRQTKNAKDNVRKNHYAAKNKKVNTVITVVTEIIDIRDVNNKNTRYMTHQVKADNGAAQEIAVQVTEIKQIAIVAPTKTSAKGTSATDDVQDVAASASAAAAMQVVASAQAPFTPSNSTMILPAGAAAPTAENVELDPAAIVEDAQTDLFVQQVIA